MKDEHRKALQECARKVRGDFQKLTTFEMINRIHIIEGRSVPDSMKGYKILRENNFIPDEFVEEGVECEKKTLKIFDSPIMHELITRFDLAVEKIKILPGMFAKPTAEVGEISESDGTQEKTGSPVDQRRREYMLQTHAVPAAPVVSETSEERTGHISKKLRLATEF